MIDVDEVTFSYDGSRRPVFTSASVRLGEGGLHLVIGATGSGKSTLLGMCNGHVPHFTGGNLQGDVTVAGRSIRRTRPRDFADVVGVVRQNPRASFVADTVRHELVYAMENLGWARQEMRSRLDEVVEALDLSHLVDRPLNQLSGGQAQRVAIGAALAARPSVLVLDEPTSGLDIDAANSVVSLLVEAVATSGLTVLISEHRLERVIGFADTVIVVDRGTVRSGRPDEMMESAPVAPPVVELGRGIGLRPLALTVSQALPHRGELLSRLADRTPPVVETRVGPLVAELRQATVSYLGRDALVQVSAEFHSGELVALIGPNGAGKSTLLGLLSGLAVPTSGSVMVGGDQPNRLPPREVVRRVGLIPQDPGLLLYSSSVARECFEADRDGGRREGTTAEWFRRFQPDVDADRHPSDLSEGQRLCLALAIVMATAPPIVLLDEPTCGLDNEAKEHLGSVLRDLTAMGTCVVVATHDVEFMAEVADRILVLNRGTVTADGPARSVIGSGEAPGPQMFQLTAPEPWLTPSEVLRALGGVD